MKKSFLMIILALFTGAVFASENIPENEGYENAEATKTVYVQLDIVYPGISNSCNYSINGGTIRNLNTGITQLELEVGSTLRIGLILSGTDHIKATVSQGYNATYRTTDGLLYHSFNYTVPNTAGHETLLIVVDSF